MGTDYSSALDVGFVLPMEDVLRPFTRTTPEMFHMEDRYDGKTGERLKPVKVVDEAEREVYTLGDEETDSAWDFVLDILAPELRCMANIFGDLVASSGFVLFGVEVFEDNESGVEDLDCGHYSAAGNLSYESVVKAAEEVKALKQLGRQHTA